MNPTGFITLTAGANLDPFLRVKLTAGKLQLAAIGDGAGVEVGTLEGRAVTDQPVAVKTRTGHAGSRYYVADGVIAQYATVYTANSGKVSATSAGATRKGIALQASAADGDLIEVLDDPA